MTTEISRSFPCPADVDTVFTAISSAGWAERKARELRDGSLVVQRELRPDGGVLLAVSRQLPDGVPGYLERFLPKDGRVVQTDDWGPARPDGTRQGTWRADIAGAPAQVGGAMRFEPSATGSTYVIDGTVRVSVPLVGGKAERFLAELIGKLMDKEAEVLRGMVSR